MKRISMEGGCNGAQDRCIKTPVGKATGGGEKVTFDTFQRLLLLSLGPAVALTPCLHCHSSSTLQSLRSLTGSHLLPLELLLATRPGIASLSLADTG
jgi:hypothetical protein